MTERGPYPRSRGQQTDRATVVGARSAQNRPVRRGASASAECPRAGLRTKFAVAEWSLCPTRHGMFPRQRVPPPFAFRMRRQKPLAEGSRRRIGQTTYLLVGQGGRWLVSCATGTGWAPAKWRYPSLLPFFVARILEGPTATTKVGCPAHARTPPSKPLVPADPAEWGADGATYVAPSASPGGAQSPPTGCPRRRPPLGRAPRAVAPVHPVRWPARFRLAGWSR